MILASKSVKLMVTLIVVSLCGLIIVQIALLQNAMRLKEQAFRDNVMSAMADITQSLASHEALVMAFLTDSGNGGQIQAEITATIDTRTLLTGKGNENSYPT